MKIMRAFVVAVLLCLTGGIAGDAGAVDRYYHWSTDQIGEQIDRMSGRRIVILYASWCPSCRKTLPRIMEIERAARGAVIAISIDENPADLLRYMDGFDDVPFPLIVLNERRRGDFTALLAEKGIRRENFIPFIALLDEQGRIADQGNLGIGTIQRFILGK